MYKEAYGEQYALNLIARISTENRVGESLAPNTIIHYTTKIKQLAGRMTGKTDVLTPEMIVRDIYQRVENKEINRVSARLEKAAALFWLADQGQNAFDSGSADF